MEVYLLIWWTKIALYFRTEWYLLCYCCCVKHPAHRNSKSRVYPLRCQDSRPPTRSYTAAAAGVAVRCCCCCGLGTRTHTRTVPLTSGWRVYIPRRGTHAQQAGPDIYRLTVTERRRWETQLATYYYSGDSPRHQQGVGPPSTASVVRASELQKPSLYVSRARHLSACMFYVSASGAIIAAATANSRRLPQQNPYKTCVSLVELGRTSRHFIVHFKIIPTKIILRYGRWASSTNVLVRGIGVCMNFPIFLHIRLIRVG